MPAAGKLLECIVLNEIKTQLVAGCGPTQLGYLPKSSTARALVALYEYITCFLDDPDVSGLQVVSNDYSEAFDRLQKNDRIQRLKECSISAPTVPWICDYLTDRQLCIRVGTACSNIATVDSGVPPGSVSGPFPHALAILET